MLQGGHLSSTEGSEESGTMGFVGLGAWFEKVESILGRVVAATGL